MSRRKKTEGEVVASEPEGRTGARTVIWTKAGEDAHAFSEHGQHKAEETVSTIYADVFIERGHATEAA